MSELRNSSFFLLILFLLVILLLLLLFCLLRLLFVACFCWSLTVSIIIRHHFNLVQRCCQFNRYIKNFLSCYFFYMSSKREGIIYLQNSINIFHQFPLSLYHNQIVQKVQHLKQLEIVYHLTLLFQYRAFPEQHQNYEDSLLHVLHNKLLCIQTPSCQHCVAINQKHCPIYQ